MSSGADRSKPRFCQRKQRCHFLSAGKYLFLVNSDVKILPGCVEGLMALMESIQDCDSPVPRCWERMAGSGALRCGTRVYGIAFAAHWLWILCFATPEFSPDS